MMTLRREKLVADAEDGAYTRHTLANRLAMSVRKIDDLNTQGLIPAPVKLGRQLRWDRLEIEEWFAAGAPSRERWEAMKAADAKKSHSTRVGRER